MKKILIIIFCIGILTCGCTQIIMWKYKITKPKIETPESILNFAKKYDQDQNNIFIFRDSASYIRSLKDTIFNKNILNILFFNQNGFFIDTHKNGQCQWSGGAFLQNYSGDSIYSIDTSFKLISITENIIPLIPRQELQDSIAVDLTIIVTWTKFIGKYNERLFCVSDVAKDRQNVKTRIILLNMDMLKEWNLRKAQMLK